MFIFGGISGVSGPRRMRINPHPRVGFPGLLQQPEELALAREAREAVVVAVADPEVPLGVERELLGVVQLAGLRAGAAERALPVAVEVRDLDALVVAVADEELGAVGGDD